MGLFKGSEKESDSQARSRPDPTGRYQVVLESAGSNKIAAIKAVRTLTEWDLAAAKDLVLGADRSPQVVVRYAEAAAADEAVVALQRAGAEAIVHVGTGLPPSGDSIGADPQVGTPTGTYVCHFCGAAGMGEFCENCGAPRRDI